jgi:hypothetical protein
MKLSDRQMNTYWNKHEKKTPVIKFIVLTLACALFAYLISRL